MHAAKKEEKFMRCRSGKVVCGQELGPWSAGHCRTSPAQVKGGKSQVLGLCISYSTTSNHPCQLMVMVSDTPGTTVLL